MLCLPSLYFFNITVKNAMVYLKWNIFTLMKQLETKSDKKAKRFVSVLCCKYLHKY